MQIIISNDIDIPIYEQIVNSIKKQIINVELVGGELLPSIRTLAKDLRISVITTKKAYEELQKQNYIEVVPSKGCYVKKKSDALLKEEVYKKIEYNVNNAISVANSYHISKEELKEIINCLMEDDINE